MSGVVCRAPGLDPAPGKTLGRILWVDDETIFLRYVEKIFARRGYNVTPALTGADGLQFGRANIFDLIILDFKLPDCSGLEVLRALRGRRVLTPVMLLTAFFDDQLANDAYKAGAIDCRLKQCVGDALVRIIEDVMRRGRPDSAALVPVEAVRDSNARVLDALERLSNRNLSSGSNVLPSVSSRVRLVLINELKRPQLSIPDLYAVAAAFRRVEGCADAHQETMLDDVRSLLCRAGSCEPLHPAVCKLVEHFETTLPTDSVLGEYELGRRLGVSGAHLGRLLAGGTGLEFRRWSIGGRFRCALRELALGREHVKQIALKNGWNNPGKFDLAFHGLLGITPSAFRALSQATPNK